METSGYVALSRQLALDSRMASLANNIANANTTGFLADEVSFQSVLSRTGPARDLAFVQDLSPKPDLTPGEMRMTGSPLDFAIGGDGFFAVQTPEGLRYTRAGHFRLDEQNQLVTTDGHPVLDVDDQPITLPEELDGLSVAKDGTIAVGADIVGQFRRALFEEPEQLRLEGGMLLRTDEVPGVAEQAEVLQGALQSSNVEPVLAMTAMMEANRAFQATQKVIEAQHELTRSAVQRLLDVNS